MLVINVGISSNSSVLKEGGESANLVFHTGCAFVVCSYDGNEIVHSSLSVSEQKSVWDFDRRAS